MAPSVFLLDRILFTCLILCIIHLIYEMENNKMTSYNEGTKKKIQQKNR